MFGVVVCSSISTATCNAGFVNGNGRILFAVFRLNIDIIFFT